MMNLFTLYLGFVLLVFDNRIQFVSATDPDVVLLTNGSDWYVNLTEFKDQAIVINIDPFDFVHDQQVILYLNGSEPHQIIQYFVSRTETKYIMEELFWTGSVEYDWVYRNVYWLQGNVIEVSDFNGTYRRVLYWKDIGEVNHMIIDPNFGVMFWSNGGNVPNIVKASMNGSETIRVEIVKDNITNPFGLATDSPQQYLYWTDSSLGLIERCRYNGTEREILLVLEEQTPGHLAFHKGTVYWIDNERRNINAFSVALNKTYTISSLPLRLTSDSFPYRYQRPPTYHIRVYDRSSTEKGHDETEKDCQHFKLLSASPRSSVCACAANFNLTDDGRCIDEYVTHDVPKLYFSTSNGFYVINNGNITQISETVLHAFVFMNEQELIGVFIDTFYRMPITNLTANMNEIKVTYRAIPWDMNYDWIGKNLYMVYNSQILGWIWILNMQDERNQVENLFYWLQGKLIIRFRLDTTKRLLFALIHGEKILRMAMDGDVDTIYEYVLPRPNYGTTFYFSIDVIEEILYVTFAESTTYISTIIRFTYDGQIIGSSKTHSFSKMLFHDIYEILYNGQGIKQCDRRYHGDCIKLLSYREYGALLAFQFHQETTDYAGHPCGTNNGNCSDMCLLTYLEPFYTCKCKVGSRILPDKKTCIVEPCMTNNGKCSMKCVDLGGLNYTCECLHGFQLGSDGRTCNGEMGYTLIEGDQKGWVQTDISSDTFPRLYTFIGMDVNNINYDPIESKIYFTALSDIITSNLDGSGLQVLSVPSRLSVDNFCFDWITRSIYWTTGLEIFYGNLDMSNTFNVSLKDIVFATKKTITSSDDLLQTDTIAIVKMVNDVFNGIVCFLWTVRLKERGEFNISPHWYNITCVENAILQGHTQYINPMHVLGNRATSARGLIIDSLNNQLFVAVFIQPLGMRIHVSFTDGNDGEQTVTEYHVLLYLGAIFEDGFLYYFEQDTSVKLMKIQLNTQEKTHVTTLSSITEVESFTGANVRYNDGGVRNCSEYSTCWSRYNSWICLDADQICDGISDCYQAHDEHYCSLCTFNCSIISFAMSCTKTYFLQHTTMPHGLSEFLNWTSHPLSKIISLENTIKSDCAVQIEMDSTEQRHIRRLKINSIYSWHKLRQVVLSMSVKDFDHVLDVKLFGVSIFVDVDPKGIRIFKNAESLELEELAIPRLPARTFFETPQLKSLSLFNNRLLSYIDEDCFLGLKELNMLSIIGSNLRHVAGTLFSDLSNLTFLSLKSNDIEILGEGIFNHLALLEILDLTGNDIKLTSELFLQTNLLQIIYCDSFTICCIKPPSVSEGNCTAPKDDISSCSNLIENRILSVFLWIFGIMALFGNLAVVIYRSFIDKNVLTKTYFFFVYNLSLADLIMSMYLLIIAWHDVRFDGTYVWNDYTWKRSIVCRFAGVLSMISSESSMMFVSLITLERFMGLKFAFGTIKISRRMAVIISIAVWILASALAVFPMVFYEEFYSRSGVCIGIPLTKENNEGFAYSIFVFLGLNFLLCLVIPFGQYYIMDEVKKSSERVGNINRGRNIAVAKRLSIVVITDCLCWLPIGILVLLSLLGVKTPREVYAWVIIFVLPVNAAVNPYLYTLTDLNKDKIRDFFHSKIKAK